MRAIIAGGGIAGLAAALSLHRHGGDVAVCEAAPAIGEVGAGIQLSPNAMKVLAALDLAEAVLAAGIEPERMAMRRGDTGAAIYDLPMRSIAARRWHGPYVHVHRADLIAILHAALAERAPDALRTGVSAKGYAAREGGAALLLDDGEAIEGDLVVAADGVRSALAAQMHPARRPRFTGQLAWRMTVPVERLGGGAPAAGTTVWTGAGRHAVTYRLRGGDLVNLVAVVEDRDWRGESWTEQGSRDEALADFEGFAPAVTGIIAAAEAHYRWALFDRPPLTRWQDGCVTLIGDAAHPMLPFLAQGAAMSIEDGWVLARTLGEHPGDVPGALTHFFQRRQPRTARVQRQARENGQMFHLRSRAEQAAVHGMIAAAARTDPAGFLGRLDWLYGFDAVGTAREG